MDSTEEVAPTEEVVKALLDYLVDPMLPLRATAKEPSLATQEAVAKQMHAVVLLYNYYHREQNPELEFLDLEAFCKLAVSLKPALMPHMKYMQQTGLTGSDDMESQLSVTEKAIKEACKIALALISSKGISDIEGWPISKVSVLLVDSKRENCLLKFSSITHGSWSVIEKCPGSSNIQPGTPPGKHIKKRKQMDGKVLLDKQSNEELEFQQVAFSAVEDEAGINQSEVVVLERNVQYSLSEENMAAYFYIMQCTQSSNETIETPIKDAIESMQGPLLKRNSNGWNLTPKIEYYDVLPYARIMSDWLSREGVSGCPQKSNCSSPQRIEQDSEKEAEESDQQNPKALLNFSIELGDVNVDSSLGPERPCGDEVPENQEKINKNCSSTDSYEKAPAGADFSDKREEEIDVREEPDECREITNSNSKSLSDVDPVASMKASAEERQLSPNLPSKRQKNDEDVPCPINGVKNKNFCGPVKVYRHQKRKISNESVNGSSLAVTGCNMETGDAQKSNDNELIVAGICSQGPTSSLHNEILGSDCALVHFGLNAEDVEKLHSMLASEAPAISEVASKILSQKRDEMSHQQHILEDKIVQCSRDLRKFTDGNQDALTSNLKALIDHCKDTVLVGKTQVQGETQCSGRNKQLQSPFEELGHLCQVNKWRLPIYCVSESPAGFIATIMMKEMELDLSIKGEMLTTPIAARESAASKMVAKLREITGQT